MDKYLEFIPLKQSKELKDKPIWAWDTETRDGLEGKLLYCWSLSTNSGGKNRDIKNYQGKTIDSFIKKLIELNPKEKKNKISIFVHNLGFDIRFVVDYCIRKNMKYKIIFANTNIILFYINDLNYRFIDSFQYLLDSQENSEITFDIDEKLRKIDCSDLFNKSHPNYKPFKKWSNEDKKRLLAHNQNDTLALQAIMKKFRQEIYEISNVDILQTNTLASLALKAFRKSMKAKIVNPYIKQHYSVKEKKYSYILDENKYEFAKSSYFGGRTECFNHNIVSNAIYYDEVSEFPSKMKFEEFPIGIPYWSTNSEEIIQSLENKLSIIEAKMIPNYNEKYPILPIRKDGKTIFGNFESVGIWNSVEIKYAIKRGYKFQFYRALIFPEKGNPFEEFIDKFFKMKSENIGAKRLIAKIILNSCYGKFGQRIYQKRTNYEFILDESEALRIYNEYIDKEIEVKPLEFNEFYQMYLLIHTEISKMMKSFQIVHLSSFITSYARLDLIKKIHEFTDNGYIVYYCDTDSIVAQMNPLIKLGKNLGCWDIECSFESFKCISPKCYIAKFDNSEFNKPKLRGKMLLKCKGIRKDKIREILANNSTIESIHNAIKQKLELDEQYLTIKTSIIQSGCVLSSKKQIKQYTLIDNKRTTLSDLTTEPISDKIMNT